MGQGVVMPVINAKVIKSQCKGHVVSPLSKKGLAPYLKNEYFNVYEKNMKARSHINRYPHLICKSSWNWTKNEIFSEILMHLV